MSDEIRLWVARNFIVWHMHTRTSIIVLHALAHRTSIFDDRTRTRSCTFSKNKCSFTALSKFCLFLIYYWEYSHYIIKVYKSQKHLFLKLHCPKNERIIWQNSALESKKWLNHKIKAHYDDSNTINSQYNHTVVCIKVRRPSFLRFWKNHP